MPILAEAVGEHAAGRAGADDDVVERLQECPPRVGSQCEVHVAPRNRQEEDRGSELQRWGCRVCINRMSACARDGGRYVDGRIAADRNVRRGIRATFVFRAATFMQLDRQGIWPLVVCEALNPGITRLGCAVVCCRDEHGIAKVMANLPCFNTARARFLRHAIIGLGRVLIAGRRSSSERASAATGVATEVSAKAGN